MFSVEGTGCNSILCDTGSQQPEGSGLDLCRTEVSDVMAVTAMPSSCTFLLAQLGEFSQCLGNSVAVPRK